MSTYADRLKALREQLKATQLDGFVVPLTDEHMSEYVGSYAQRLAWLTGFQGSAGSAVVLPEEAAIFVDGRYTLQVRAQVDGSHWSYQSVPETSIAEWLRSHPAVRLKVEGHCDERGSEEYNLGLGDRRANAVKNYLISLGIDAGRMNPISYGKERPQCREATEDCYQKNRRAHFVMTGR